MQENKKYENLYVVSDLKRVGPSNQTLNIIKNLSNKDKCLVITLFKEPEDSMIDVYRKNSIDIYMMNLNRITFALNGSIKLRKLIKKFNVKIVHSYGVKPDYICQKAVKRTQAKHIITLRNYPKEDILTRMGFVKGRIALYSHLRVLKKAKYIVACSKTIENKMKNDYPKMNIVAIQNGVDTDKYKKVTREEKNEIRKKYKFETNKKIFISTSSFIPRKRIEETIKTFEVCNIENKFLILLGTGSEFEEIYKKYSNNKEICFVGKTDKVNEYLKMSDIFLSSSESEGLPNGVIEAIASGLPVILSNIPQHLEVLEEIPFSGISYELGNIEDFCEKIEKNVCYENSKSDIMNSNLSMKSMSKKYEEFYKLIH